MEAKKREKHSNSSRIVRYFIFHQITVCAIWKVAQKVLCTLERGRI